MGSLSGKSQILEKKHKPAINPNSLRDGLNLTEGEFWNDVFGDKFNFSTPTFPIFFGLSGNDSYCLNYPDA